MLRHPRRVRQRLVEARWRTFAGRRSQHAAPSRRGTGGAAVASGLYDRLRSLSLPGVAVVVGPALARRSGWLPSFRRDRGKWRGAPTCSARLSTASTSSGAQPPRNISRSTTTKRLRINAQLATSRRASPGEPLDRSGVGDRRGPSESRDSRYGCSATRITRFRVLFPAPNAAVPACPPRVRHPRPGDRT